MLEPAKREKVIDPDNFSARAYEHFIPGKRTCSEAILMAGCEALGIESDLVPDIALGLGGGVGAQGHICGVLTGSAMVLSLAVSAKESDYRQKQMQTFQSVGRVCGAFEKRFGAVDCRTLSGLDLTTPEGRKQLTAKVKAETCANYVKAGAEILAAELQTI
jgi:C_GCAxxG_C_C family probable redox protein